VVDRTVCEQHEGDVAMGAGAILSGPPAAAVGDAEGHCSIVQSWSTDAARLVTLGKGTFEVAATDAAAINLAETGELFSGEYQVGRRRFRLIDIAWRSQRG
jgi:hypothetical protein